MPGQTASPSLICVAKIASAHGIRGEVKLLVYATNPSALSSYNPLTNASGTRQFVVTSRSINGDIIIARIEGVTTRNDAEALKGTELYAKADLLPAPQEDEYYYHELEGMAAHSPDGTFLGTVTEVHNFGAGDIIEIRHTNGETEMYSFTSTTVPAVDRTARTLTLVIPDVLEARE